MAQGVEFLCCPTPPRTQQQRQTATASKSKQARSSHRPPLSNQCLFEWDPETQGALRPKHPQHPESRERIERGELFWLELCLSLADSEGPSLTPHERGDVTCCLLPAPLQQRPGPTPPPPAMGVCTAFCKDKGRALRYPSNQLCLLSIKSGPAARFPPAFACLCDPESAVQSLNPTNARGVAHRVLASPPTHVAPASSRHPATPFWFFACVWGIPVLVPVVRRLRLAFALDRFDSNRFPTTRASPSELN